MDFTPISDFALISDCRTAALVSRAGSIDWLCWPHFENSAFFANILDPDRGGYWRLAPKGPAVVKREYLEGTNVLSSIWQGAGEAEVIDFMPVGKFDGLVPEHAVIRLIRCTAGEVAFQSVVSARGNYGKTPMPWKAKRGHHRSHFKNFQFTLQSFGCDHVVQGDGLVAEFSLKAGERAGMVLSANREGPAVFLTELQLWRLLAATVDEWRTWTARCTYRGPHHAVIARSALVLKALNFAPSGAVVAAPTASLPEREGGELNWDYRYCWLRDASHTTRALWDLGFDQEADAFASWLLHATALSRPRLRVLYDVFGRRPSPERDAGWLRGYRDSRPVRLGNAAESQHQLDLYGELMEAANQQIMHHRRVDGETAQLLLDIGEFACKHWREADAGIWEYRNELRHHTHSKVFCWVAVDRVARLQDLGLLPHTRINFHEVRETIAAYILAHAAENDGILTAAAGDPEMDASVLLAATFGCVPPEHPVMVKTFERLQQALGTGDGLFYRAERFVGREGAFLFCSFWAVEYLAMRGDLELAEDWFGELLSLQNDVGLYGEEVAIPAKETLGNFPQAFSHVGLINAALAIARAREGRQPGRSRDGNSVEAREKPE
jgi:GH15 family glucan-1,4-alpha-glucosidase